METKDIRVIRPACERGIKKYKNTVGFEISTGLVKRKILPSGPIPKVVVTEIGKELYKKVWGKRTLHAFYPYRSPNKPVVDEIVFDEKHLLNLLSGDRENMSIGMSTFRYFDTPESDREVYIFEGKFFREFSKLSIKKLKKTHLPKNKVGCIVLPEALPYLRHYVKEIIFNLESYGNRLEPYTHDNAEFFQMDINQEPPQIYTFSGSDLKRLFNSCDVIQKEILCTLTFVDPEGTIVRVVNLVIPEAENTLVSDILSVVTKVNQPNRAEKDNEDASALLSLTMNLLAYIQSGQPDIREFRNIIRYRGKSTVHVRPEDEELTKSRVFLVGFNWMKERVYHIDGWHSSAYMAWKMCGPGRTMPKLVSVRGSFKRRRKGKESDSERTTEEGISQADGL